MYFHTDDPTFVSWFSEVLKVATHEGRRLRLDVDSEGSLRIKVGEGVWSPPFSSTPDPYRDQS